jgi:tRNA nucleotidyltransferase (CCA-adding enzyme)
MNTELINENYKLMEIAQEIDSLGGELYLVGGSVIDIISKRDIKDWDIEVHGITESTLENILSNHGRPVSCGKSFDVIKQRIEDIDYDFSFENIPGSERLDLEELSSRRDLTINSMMYNLVTGELYDGHNGIKDLDEGIIRHVSDKFIDDPLRVLRIMQLLPRKGKVVHEDTLELCRNNIKGFDNIFKERIYEEFNKLLLKPKKPSMGIQFLYDSDWIKCFPDLYQNQNKLENGLEYTKKVIDNATEYRDIMSDKWKKAFMYSSLFSTEDNSGDNIKYAQFFLNSITDDNNLKNYVKIILEGEKEIKGLDINSSEYEWKKVHNKVPLNIVGMYLKASNVYNDPLLEEKADRCLMISEKYNHEKIVPLITGKDLISRGYKSGPYMGKELSRLYEIQLRDNIESKDNLFSFGGF